MKPLADLNEQEVILLLPQITPSRWHDAFKAAKLTGAMLNSVAELNDITKYNIKFKRLEFESFMNRLAVYKTSGVPLLILVEVGSYCWMQWLKTSNNTDIGITSQIEYEQRDSSSSYFRGM